MQQRRVWLSSLASAEQSLHSGWARHAEALRSSASAQLGPLSTAVNPSMGHIFMAVASESTLPHHHEAMLHLCKQSLMYALCPLSVSDTLLKLIITFSSLYTFVCTLPQSGSNRAPALNETSPSLSLHHGTSASAYAEDCQTKKRKRTNEDHDEDSHMEKYEAHTQSEAMGHTLAPAKQGKVDSFLYPTKTDTMSDAASEEKLSPVDNSVGEHEHDELQQSFSSIHDYMRARSKMSDTSASKWESSNAVVHDEDRSDQRRLFVRNLAYSATEADIRSFFEDQSGTYVEDVHILLSKETLQPRGLAYITLPTSAAAYTAICNAHQNIMHGRILSVSWAISKRSAMTPERTDSDQRKGSTSSFKRQQASYRVEFARNRKAWNALFLRLDAIADAIADRLGVSKADVLHPEGNRLAVKLSIGEAEIIDEAKRSLAAQGVDVALLERAAESAGPDLPEKESLQRSSTTLLLKNLPYSATHRDLASMCEKFGTLSALVMPSCGMLAIVDYADAADAKKAFKRLAFKRYGQKPLYVDFAPVNVFQPCAKDSVNTVSNEVTTTKSANMESDSRTLCIRNVPTNSGDHEIRALVEKHGAAGCVQSVRMQRESYSKDATMALVQLISGSDPHTIASSVAGSKMGARQLAASVQPHVAEDAEANDLEMLQNEVTVKLKEPKLLVRNVPFEAKRSEMRELFKPFGTVKAVRLPKKMGGVHRGFAFVEMTSKAEARRAMGALKSAHFYGRHLVVEPAKQAEGVEELRERAQRVAEQTPQADPQLH